MAFGWEGEKVRLVPLDYDKHFENYIKWLNDPAVTENLALTELPLTRIAEKEWFDQASSSSPQNIVFAIETLGGKHLGSSGIHNVDHLHGTATTGSFIGDTHEWGKGYGLDAAKVRSRFCFERLNLRLLRSSYFEGNERSERMQIAAGFVEIGRWPKAIYRAGRYRDEILMCLTRDRWEELERNVDHRMI